MEQPASEGDKIPSRQNDSSPNQLLAGGQPEQDPHLKALYASARANLHFEDVDIPDLEMISAGPVEILE